MRTDAISLTAALTLVALLGAAPAAAQSANRFQARVEAAVSKIRDACAADVQKFCSTVTPGEGRILLCMEAHEDKISTKCDFALFEASRNLERALDKVEMAADACWPDIQKSCADAVPGGGNILQCLASKKETLGKACQRVVSKFQAAK
ncbi:MAG: cysteine rich repeat-containing protein [Alsobacter sp.]